MEQLLSKNGLPLVLLLPRTSGQPLISNPLLGGLSIALNRSLPHFSKFVFILFIIGPSITFEISLVTILIHTNLVQT